MEGSDAFFAKQLDIGSLYQLMRLDAKPPHEFVRLAHPRFCRLILAEHNLQFKEVPQPIHPVEVNACSADEKQ